MLAGIYYGSQYGGSTTSILMRIPGEASSVMTCIDGLMAQKSAPARVHCCGQLVYRRDFRRDHAHRGGAAARQFRAALRPARVHGAAGARPHLPRLHVLDLAGAHAADGRGRAAARLHRHRRHERPLPLQLRHQGAGRRHRHRACRGGAVRTGRDPVDAQQDGHATGREPAPARAASQRHRMAPVGHADRARLRARLLRRHRTGLGAHHRELPLLCGGEAHLQDTRGIWQGCSRRRGGSGIGQQFGLHRRLRAHAGPGPADRAGHRRADGCAADPRCAARAAARQRAPGRVLGLHRLHVRGQPDAAGAEFAVRRPVRERAAHPLCLPLSAHRHVLHHRRLRGEAIPSSTSGSC